MQKRKLFGCLMTAMALMVSTVFTQVPVRADALRVVTLGADLSDAQKSKMLTYFKVSKDEVRIIYVTNKDERERLGGFIPLEQIGTRTVSCAYVRPTTSGGIKVRTANLNYVTGNMIASSLSTSGVSNCEVVAACPFEVSGTGALTGVLMAYEVASGTTLDSTKKEIATQEIITTANLADQVGEQQAVNVVNKAKTEIIANNIQDADEIYNTVVNIVNQNGVQISSEELDEIVALLQQIAAQNYNYADVEETLNMVDHNVSGQAEETDEEIDFEVEGEEGEMDVEDGDSIISGLDENVLGEDVITSSTAFEDQETVAGEAEDMGDPVDTWETFDTEGIPVTDDELNATTDMPIEDEGFNTGVADDVEALDIGTISGENLPNTESEDDSLSTLDGDDSAFDEMDETWTDDLDETAIEDEDETAIEDEDETTDEVEDETTDEDEDTAETTSDTWDVSTLDKVSQGQFKSAKSYVEKNYSDKGSVSLKDATAKALQNYVLGEYFKILSGASSYTSTRQAFLSGELNIVDQMLMETFGAEGATMSDAASEILGKLSSSEAEQLYKNSIAYFATLYGESVATEESADGWEDIDSLEDDLLEDEVLDGEEMVWE